MHTKNNFYNFYNFPYWDMIDIGEIFITDHNDIEFVKFEGLVTVEEAQKNI